MEQKLNVTDRYLYSMIYAYTQRQQPFTADNKTIAREMGKSVETISHSITRLIQSGYVKNEGNKYARQLFCAKRLIKVANFLTVPQNPQKSANANVKNDVSSEKNYIRNVKYDDSNVKNDVRNVIKNVRNVKRILANVKNDGSLYKYNFDKILLSFNNIFNIYINIINYYYNNITTYLPTYLKEKEKEKEKGRQAGRQEFFDKKGDRKQPSVSHNPSTLSRIKNWWNETIVDQFGLEPISFISGIRRDNIMERIFDCHGEENFKKILYDAIADQYVNGDGFMFGENKRKWKMDFDWILFPDHFNALVEKKYLQSSEKKNIIPDVNKDERN